jgi:hypothetical protein
LATIISGKIVLRLGRDAFIGFCKPI